MKKIFISMLLFLGVFSLSGCWITQHGVREGNIFKLADEGVICQTHEGELIKGGMSGGSGSFGVEPFNFTIEDPKVLALAQQAMTEDKEVRIYYHHEVGTLCRTETVDNMFVDKIEILK